MKIQSKISLIILGFFSVLLLLAIVLSQTMLLNNYKDIDSQRAGENSARNSASIETRLAALATYNRDWAAWDSTYQFIGDLNEQYIQENIIDTTFTNANLGFMIFLDVSGNVKYAPAYDSISNNVYSMDAEQSASLLSNTLLADSLNDRSSIQGLCYLNDELFLVVSDPILLSNGQGTPNGFLIIGQHFDAQTLKEISQESSSTTTLLRISDPKLPEDFQSAFNSLAGGDYKLPFIRVQNDQQVSAYCLIGGVNGDSDFILRTDSTRDVFHRGQKTITWFLFSFGAAGLLSGLGMYFIVGSSVIRPIVKLGKDTRAAGNSSAKERKLVIVGKDEIATLGHSINLAFQEISGYEMSLSRSAQEWQTTFDSISDPISIIDSEYRIIRVNKAYSKALHMEPEDLVGRCCHEVVHGSNKPISKCPLLQTLSSKRPVTAEVFDLGRDRYSEVTTYPVFNQADSITSVIHIAKDITQRKKTEAQLESISIHQQTVLSAVPDIIMEVDNNKTYTWANQAGLEFFGDDVIGKEASYYFEGEDRPYDVVQPVFDGSDETIYVQSWQRRKDGEKRLLAWWCRALKDNAGHVVGALSAANDITEWEQAKIEQHELRQKAEMSSRLTAVGEMAAGIAHEINNPLTGVIGFSELLLERTGLPDDVREELKIINDGSTRVKEIVSRMLTFARQTKPHKSSVSVTELLDNTLELRSYVLKTSNIEVIRDYDPQLPSVTADAGQLQQVFLNLIVNAEYAMKKANDKGILTIRSEVLDDRILVSISDNGTGMSDEVKAKLFQPFFTTKDPGEGTGLGLSLSHGIIEEHGGSIRAESGVGKGTTFIIELPITPVETPPLIEVPTSDVIEPVKRAKVLVVDDEPTVRSLIKTILTQDGHTVEECDNSEQVLEILRDATYDILLVDLRMPGKSGLELYGEISTRWPKIAHRVIFITGDTSELNTQEYLASHQIPFVTKPFNRKTLEDKVNSVLQSN